MTTPKIIDNIYVANTPPPAHLKGNVLEIRNSSDKNYNLKIGNNLISPIVAGSTISEIEKVSGNRIGTIGIAATQTDKIIGGSLMLDVPYLDSSHEAPPNANNPGVLISSISLGALSSLSEEEWNTLKNQNDGSTPISYLGYYSAGESSMLIQVAYFGLSEEDLIELPDGRLVEGDAFAIELMKQDYFVQYVYSRKYNQVVFAADNQGAVSVFSNNSEAQKSINEHIGEGISLHCYTIVDIPIDLAKKINNALLPSCTIKKAAGVSGILVRNTNSWDTVLTTSNISTVLPVMQSVDVEENDLPSELEWNKSYGIHLDFNVYRYCSLPSVGALPPASSSTIIEVWGGHTDGVPHLSIGNEGEYHWINDCKPSSPAGTPLASNAGRLGIIVHSLGFGYAFWKN